MAGAHPLHTVPCPGDGALIWGCWKVEAAWTTGLCPKEEEGALISSLCGKTQVWGVFSAC